MACNHASLVTNAFVGVTTTLLQGSRFRMMPHALALTLSTSADWIDFYAQFVLFFFFFFFFLSIILYAMQRIHNSRYY